MRWWPSLIIVCLLCEFVQLFNLQVVFILKIMEIVMHTPDIKEETRTLHWSLALTGDSIKVGFCS